MCMQKLTTNNVTAPDEALLCGQVSMGYILKTIIHVVVLNGIRYVAASI